MCDPASSTSSLFPRRTLSVNDSSGKRGARLRRSSLSDLTDESCSAKEEILFPEIVPSLKYSEFVTVAGVSDIPMLYQDDTDDGQLPLAPCAVARRKSKPKPTAKALVSLTSPHKLLIVTKEFCDLFGYFVDSEICGRALKTLVGPRTDLSAVLSGMQSVAMIDIACFSLALYNRDGEEVKVEVTFSPYMSDSETLSGCLLDVVPMIDAPIAQNPQY